MLLDYATRPSVGDARLLQVTNTLAHWLPSDGDASAVAGWDDEAWRAVEWVAYWQGAVPWLVERIRATDAPVPSGVRERLLALDADNRERTRRLLANAVELLDALLAEGIQAIPLKGAVLAPLYYEDPLQRPMTDLDVLVHPQDVGRGRQVLQELGYRFHSRSAEDVVYLRGEWMSHGWSPDNVHPVEMHYAVREEYAGLAFELDGEMWRSATRQPYWGGSEALVPSLPVLLCHVCAHATSDWLIRRGRLYQIGDIRRLAARMAEADWEVLAAMMHPYNARFVYPALAFTLKYANVADEGIADKYIRIPSRVMDALRLLTPPRLRAWVERTDLADASVASPAGRSGIGFDIARTLAWSGRERARMGLRSLFPRRWNLAQRYPRLVASPLWPLCYVLLNADRLWHIAHQRWMRGGSAAAPPTLADEGERRRQQAAAHAPSPSQGGGWGEGGVGAEGASPSPSQGEGWGEGGDEHIPTHPPCIRTERLTKVFHAHGREIRAVQDVSLEVRRGELFGLFGPNGAGKSTLVRTLATLLAPTRGSATVNGFDVVRAPLQVRASIGLVASDERSFYGRLSGRQNLWFYAALQNVPRVQAKARTEAVLTLFDLQAKAGVPFQSLSTGQKQRLNMARALIHDPPILFLDEPTKSMDVQTSDFVKALIKEELVARQGKTVVFISHELYEMDNFCDRVAILADGTLQAVGTPQELGTLLPRPGLGAARYRVEVEGDADQIAAIVAYWRSLPQVQAVAEVAGEYVRRGLTLTSFDVTLADETLRMSTSGRTSTSGAWWAILEAVAARGGRVETYQRVDDGTLRDVIKHFGERADGGHADF